MSIRFFIDTDFKITDTDRMQIQQCANISILIQIFFDFTSPPAFKRGIIRIAEAAIQVPVDVAPVFPIGLRITHQQADFAAIQFNLAIFQPPMKHHHGPDTRRFIAVCSADNHHVLSLSVRRHLNTVR